jgi:hypothetical protein
MLKADPAPPTPQAAHADTETTMTDRHQGFSLSEVTALGFEARCVVDGRVEYLWHRGWGLRFDPAARSTTLITDIATLPEGPWTATELGLQELRDPTLLEPA